MKAVHNATGLLCQISVSSTFKFDFEVEVQMPLVISSFVSPAWDLARYFSDTANMNNLASVLLCCYHPSLRFHMLLGMKENSTDFHEIQ